MRAYYAQPDQTIYRFIRIAAAYGIEGVRVTSSAEVIPSIQDVFNVDGPYMMDFRIEREENVFPMVRAGAVNHEMKPLKPYEKSG